MIIFFRQYTFSAQPYKLNFKIPRLSCYYTFPYFFQKLIQFQATMKFKFIKKTIFVGQINLILVFLFYHLIERKIFSKKLSEIVGFWTISQKFCMQSSNEQQSGLFDDCPNIFTIPLEILICRNFRRYLEIQWSYEPNCYI